MAGTRGPDEVGMGEATRRLCGSWWPPLVPREQVDHDQQALTAVRTEPTGLERAYSRAGGWRTRSGDSRGTEGA